MKFHFDESSKAKLSKVKASYNDASQAMSGMANALEELSAHATAPESGNQNSEPQVLCQKLDAHLALCKQAMKELTTNHQALKAAVAGHVSTEPEDDADPDDEPDEDPEEGDEKEQAILQALEKMSDEDLSKMKVTA